MARCQSLSLGVPTGRARLIGGRALDVLPRLSDAAYDLVFCDANRSENPDYVQASLRLLRPGGLLIMSTPARTGWSRLLTITLAEGTGRIPRGTHDFDQFLSPEQLTALLAAARLEVTATRGIAFSAGRGLHLSQDLSLNYLVAARHA